KQASAEKLPFNNDSFDCYTISFGIRNVTNIEIALAEVLRVLKPGGIFICLEFSKVRPDILKPFYNIHLKHVIPNLGAAVTGDREAYQYLVDSIEQFPAQAKFARMLKQVGLVNIDYNDLTMGVVALHKGYKA
ncbi:MAG: ubiquinone/menaquinone biosynthesis methyltransferase, partial [Pseudomonadota bacterium]